MAIVYIDGFESGLFDNAGAVDNTLNQRYFSTVNNPAAVSYVAGRTGNALRVAQTGAATTRAILGDIPTALQSQKNVWAFYVRVAAAPSVRSTMWSASTPGGATECCRLEVNTSGQIEASISGSERQTGPVISDGLWHRVDYYLDSSVTPNTIQWKIDGVAQTDVSTTPGTFLGTFTGSASDAKDNAFAGGFVAGLGMDVLLMPNVFLRGEWEYVAFGTIGGVRTSINVARAGLGLRF